MALAIAAACKAVDVDRPSTRTEVAPTERAHPVPTPSRAPPSVTATHPTVAAPPRARITALRGVGSTVFAWSSDGAVHGWGNNGDGRIDPALPACVTAPVPTEHRWASIAADIERPLDETLCGLASAGTVTCFGRYAAQAHAQLAARGETQPTAIALGSSWGCAKDPRGVRCQGRAPWLGPTQPGLELEFEALADATALSMSEAHACVLRADRSVACWGDRRRSAVDGARVHDATTRSASSPIAIAGLHDAVEIALANALSCARTVDGGVTCWGDPFYGRGAVPLAEVRGATALVSDGARRICVLAKDSPPRCLGSTDDTHVVLGAGPDAGEQAALLTPLIDRVDVEALALNPDSACVATTTDGVLCWGANEHGQLGDGTMLEHGTPAPVVGL